MLKLQQPYSPNEENTIRSHVFNDLESLISQRYYAPNQPLPSNDQEMVHHAKQFLHGIFESEFTSFSQCPSFVILFSYFLTLELYLTS